MSEEKKETFTYTYSARQQEEIRKIRQRYLPAETAEVDKMARLRALDRSVTKKGTTIALTVGIIGALVMGFGMSLVMTDLSDWIGATQPLIPGIVIGVIGILGVIAAHPLYQRITRKERERLAPEILRLADELTE